jgi:hypothetical protein
MKIDSYKSQILDGVLMVLVQKQNRASPCLKSYNPCLKFWVLNVHVGTKTRKFPLPVMDMPVCVLRSVHILAHALTGTGICI